MISVVFLVNVVKFLLFNGSYEDKGDQSLYFPLGRVCSCSERRTDGRARRRKNKVLHGRGLFQCSNSRWGSRTVSIRDEPEVFYLQTLRKNLYGSFTSRNRYSRRSCSRSRVTTRQSRFRRVRQTLPSLVGPSFSPLTMTVDTDWKSLVNETRFSTSLDRRTYSSKLGCSLYDDGVRRGGGEGRWGVKYLFLWFWFSSLLNKFRWPWSLITSTLNLTPDWRFRGRELGR